MNLIPTIAKAAGLSVLIFLSGKVFIPDKFFVERTVFVSVSDTAAFSYAANYTLFNTWNPYYKRDPGAKYSINGQQGVPGYSFSWQGKELGKGKFEFIDKLPYKALYQKITMDSPLPGTYDNNLFFYADYKGTFVTWTLSGENRTLLDRWKSLFYNNTIGEDFQDGLDRLKDELEKQPLAHLELPPLQ